MPLIFDRSREATERLQKRAAMKTEKSWLEPNDVYLGDSTELIPSIRPNSIACSVWSPPYHVGKEYEKAQSFDEWRRLLQKIIVAHYDILIPGGFMVINIADILAFPDPSLPRIQAPNVANQRSPVSREDVLRAKNDFPHFNRNQLAAHLGCSEQTIDRRLNGNNIRGGKYATQTRVQLVGSIVADFAQQAGMHLYDRRIWMKDPTWANNQWHSSSYRSVSEFEDIYFFWKPGETIVDRNRLEREEWSAWGSRQVWQFRSVRANDEHEAKFPMELPRRVIRLLTNKGDTVLDCFMGSGTTALAAIQEERQFIGIELLEPYVTLAKQNIAKALREKQAQV
jgi:DNA modification methylase